MRKTSRARGTLRARFAGALMQADAKERRTLRSLDAQQALSLQLERVRDEARLDALVLATDEGLPVAQSGEAELCAELAALAPFLLENAGPGRADDPKRANTQIRAMDLSGLPLYLVSYSLDAARGEHWLEHASRGVTRILKPLLS